MLRGSPPAARTLLSSLLDDFVQIYLKGPRQRSEAWLQAKRGCVGGSELATLLGCNKYSNPVQMLMDKSVPRSARAGGGTPCYWGILFEGICEILTELDLGTKVVGSDIHIPAGAACPYHANSPDGYCLVDLYRYEADGRPLPAVEPQWQLWCEGDGPEEGRPYKTRTAIVLLEFKSPYRRRPNGQVPANYVPQVLSGLGLSPPADFGLYVDMLYKICRLGDLGLTPEYNQEYHNDWKPVETLPFAWGRMAVYGADGTSCVAEMGATDPGDIAKRILRQAAQHGSTDPIDFGCLPAWLFNQTLEHVNNGLLLTRYVEVTLAQGPQRKEEETPPAGYTLLGYIPWKCMEAHYIPVKRDAGFLDRCRPLVSEFIERLNVLHEAALGQERNLLLENARDHYQPRRKKTAARASSGPSKDELEFFAEMAMLRLDACRDDA